MAEVLITLSILGVVAAIMIPSTVQRFQDRVTLTKFKKTYSIIENAIQQMYIIDGYPDNWDNWVSNTAQQRASNFSNKLQKYINHKPSKGLSTSYKNLTSTTNWNPYTSSFYNNSEFALPDGTTIVIKDFRNADYYIQMFFDINGKKAPNRFGYDAFFFYIDKKSGIRTGNVFNAGDKNTCTINNNDSSNGNTCGQWIIKHGNMDYKYRDVRSEW